MINNRQGGRRRGRGGQRNQSLGGQSGGGNRQDNRQRGNAAQLLEKYKSMARDAQLAGDRVQSEYYLQFADHYFRVLSESRSRFEDQRRPRDDDMDDDEGEDEAVEAGADESGSDGAGEQRFERPQRRDRGDRGDRGERGERRFARDDERGDRDERNGAQVRGNAAGEGIPVDILPPAIGVEQGNDAGDGDEPAARPRRRTRRPRPEDEGDIAPAA
ncbi:MAG TPA: DUF4167 domain-containing protein [Sphingomicrobium sp.]|nr:DUF4167 domain-containing protein [Sphingomicrobium sp.]